MQSPFFKRRSQITAHFKSFCEAIYTEIRDHLNETKLNSGESICEVKKIIQRMTNSIQAHLLQQIVKK